MQIYFQADTSVSHTPPTMSVCVPVKSGAKSIDGTARYAVSRHVFNNVFLTVPASHFPLHMGSGVRPKQSKRKCTSYRIGRQWARIAHMCVADDIFFMFLFF